VECEDIGGGFEFADGDEADLQWHATRARSAINSSTSDMFHF
jgi:hypothetical protein